MTNTPDLIDFQGLRTLLGRLLCSQTAPTLSQEICRSCQDLAPALKHKRTARELRGKEDRRNYQVGYEGLSLPCNTEIFNDLPLLNRIMSLRAVSDDGRVVGFGLES